MASGLICVITFSGSVLAFAKLQQLISGNPITNPLLKFANALGTIGAIAVAIMLFMHPEQVGWYWALVTLSLLVGVFLVLPIGGADMPVVITLLNSYSGIAAAATGFVLNNNVLIIAGALVGASGLILTKVMCVAMNRSLTNVLFGFMAEVAVGPKKKRTLIAIARVLVRTNGWAGRPIRIDVVAVLMSPDAKPTVRHHVNAVTLDDVR